MIFNVGAGGASNTESIKYNNAESGLEATNVQGAIDEVNNSVNEVNDSLTADNAQAFQFAYDSASGKYGYKVKEADTDVFVPFKSGMNIGTYGYHVINSTTAGYVCIAITEDFTQSIVTGSNTETSFKTISGVCSANYGKIKVLANGFKYKYRDSAEWVEASIGTEFASGNGTIFTWG